MIRRALAAEALLAEVTRPSRAALALDLLAELRRIGTVRREAGWVVLERGDDVWAVADAEGDALDVARALHADLVAELSDDVAKGRAA